MIPFFCKKKRKRQEDNPTSYDVEIINFFLAHVRSLRINILIWVQDFLKKSSYLSRFLCFFMK